jgi:hypothetical protein
MITDIENSLRAQGYSPGYSTVDEHLGALLWFGAGIEFPGGLDVRLETGSALAKYATFHVAELMVLYHLPPLTSDQFSVVIGAGGTIALFGFNRTFNYGTRISVIDANGGYTVLDDLTVSGSANAGGVVALAGVEVLPTASRDLTLGLSARYQHLGKLPVNAVSTYSSQIDLSGVLVVFTVAVNF